jgi:hypothetical protein
MIYMAPYRPVPPYVMFLMRANLLRGKVGGGFGPWKSRLFGYWATVSFVAQKSLHLQKELHCAEYSIRLNFTVRGIRKECDACVYVCSHSA